MRIAVLSDIHANLHALDAILTAAGAVDAIWHLGDVVGYGPEPDEVVGRLAELGAVGVRGNHDLAATGSDAIRDFNVDARAAMEWTRRTISPATRAWLGGLPETRTIERFTLVHGSLRDPTWEYILDESAAAASLARLTTPFGLFGHTHLPALYVADGALPDDLDGGVQGRVDGRVEGRLPPTGRPVGLPGHRALLNPGSVGQPRDGDPRASAIVLDLARRHVTWIRVDYDIEATQRSMRSAGLPARGVARLSLGM